MRLVSCGEIARKRLLEAESGKLLFLSYGGVRLFCFVWKFGEQLWGLLLVGHDVFFERQAWWQVVFEVEFLVERLYSGGASTCDCLWGVPTVSFVVLPLLYVVFEGCKVVSWNYWRKACDMSTILHFSLLLKWPLGVAWAIVYIEPPGVLRFIFIELASEKCRKFSLGFWNSCILILKNVLESECGRPWLSMELTMDRFCTGCDSLWWVWQCLRILGLDYQDWGFRFVVFTSLLKFYGDFWDGVSPPCFH